MHGTKLIPCTCFLFAIFNTTRAKLHEKLKKNSTRMLSPSESKCNLKNALQEESFSGVHCEAEYDGFVCWPPTKAGSIALQSCPLWQLSNPSKLAYMECDEFGKWIFSDTQNFFTSKNYRSCLPDEEIVTIARNNRGYEIIGLIISIISLVTGITLIHLYQNLKEDRVRIHKCLFISMTLENSFLLVTYADQDYFRKLHEDYIYLCPILTILTEYTFSSTIFWMFVVGAYIISLLHGNSLQQRHCNSLLIAAGWLIPCLYTGIWAIWTYIYYSESPSSYWFNYIYLPNFYVLRGPRLFFLVFNSGFIMHILHTLKLVLPRNISSNAVLMRKLITAAMMLIPLLGVTNIFVIMPPPVTNAQAYKIWSYANVFRSFDGFAISVTFCFVTYEVQKLFKHPAAMHLRRLLIRHSQRDGPVQRRAPYFFKPDENIEMQNIPPGTEAAVEPVQEQNDVIIAQFERVKIVRNLNVITETDESSSNGNSLTIDELHLDCKRCDEVEEKLEAAEKGVQAKDLVAVPIKKSRRRLSSNRMRAHDMHWMEIEARSGFRLAPDPETRMANMNLNLSPEHAGPSGTNCVSTISKNMSTDDDDYFGSDDEVFYP